MEVRAVIGIDVGGTAMKAWWTGADGTSTAVPGAPTPRPDPTGEATADAVAALVARSGPVAAIGLAVPGIVDGPAGICRMSVNLGWREVPVRDLVADRTGLPVVLSQDVRAGARGEWRSGAGADRPGGLLFAPLGTGLAVAQVDADGRPIGGSSWAGEVGQLRWTAGPHTGLRVEEVASAGGLAVRFAARGAIEVLAAMRAGDEVARRLWLDTADAVAEVLSWAVALTAPATVVLGGGLAQAGDALLDPVRAGMAARLAGFPEPVVTTAVHGIDASAVGAADLALEHLGTGGERLPRSAPTPTSQGRAVPREREHGRERAQ